jgi:23S rRNA (guanosine2251-2'-O)-methyltransferase
MNRPREDSTEYLEKKRFFDSLMTVYGRKTVLEALQDPSTCVYRLHLAKSNKTAGILDEILELAKSKGAEIVFHERQALSRISKNAAQDQGVAADLQLQGYQRYDQFIAANKDKKYTLLALDGVQNPQNLGMIIRSACAGNIDGILLPQKGNAQIDPLVIKASAGTVFRAPLLRCKDLKGALNDFQQQGTIVCVLSSHAKLELKKFSPTASCIFVLGNESEGVSKDIEDMGDEKVCIPMNNGVESLNVAVTAALIAFK